MSGPNWRCIGPWPLCGRAVLSLLKRRAQIKAHLTA